MARPFPFAPCQHMQFCLQDFPDNGTNEVQETKLWWPMLPNGGKLDMESHHLDVLDNNISDAIRNQVSSASLKDWKLIQPTLLTTWAQGSAPADRTDLWMKCNMVFAEADHPNQEINSCTMVVQTDFSKIPFHHKTWLEFVCHGFPIPPYHHTSIDNSTVTIVAKPTSHQEIMAVYAFLQLNTNLWSRFALIL